MRREIMIKRKTRVVLYHCREGDAYDDEFAVDVQEGVVYQRDGEHRVILGTTGDYLVYAFAPKEGVIAVERMKERDAAVWWRGASKVSTLKFGLSASEVPFVWPEQP